MSNQAAIRDYVIELIGYATEFTQQAGCFAQCQRKTPIFFLATAGMRLLLEPNADAMMDAADAVFLDTSVNPFMYTSLNTRILSGEEEGAFQWITVNYLRGFFSDKDDKPAQVGILEMGGASTQIAFVPEVSTLAGKFRITLGGRHYPLYVHSYLNYGSTASLRWAAKTFAQDPDYVLHTDETTNTTYINNPCVLREDSTLETVGGMHYNSTGTGNYVKCTELIDQHVYKVPSSLCRPAPCGIGPFYQPSIPDNMDFYAVAAFIFPAKVFGILGEDGRVIPKEYGDAARDYCQMTLAEATELARNNSGEVYQPSSRCMMGLYTEKLWITAYGFDSHSDNIYVVDRIDDNKISWCLGALLYEGSDDLFSRCSIHSTPLLAILAAILLTFYNNVSHW